MRDKIICGRYNSGFYIEIVRGLKLRNCFNNVILDCLQDAVGCIYLAQLIPPSRTVLIKDVIIVRGIEAVGFVIVPIICRAIYSLFQF